MLIDQSHGHVLRLGGDVYYSPNCSRVVALPQDPPNNSQKIFHVDSAQLRNFQRPRWWTTEFGWLAFVPLNPPFIGYPFDCLAHIPPRADHVGGGLFQLNSVISNKWHFLEDSLARATSKLAAMYQVAAVRPFLPWACGYRKTYRGYHGVQRRSHFARDWFTVWMGLFSYLIAVGNRKRHNMPVVHAPGWFQTLVGAEFPQQWLSGINSSVVGDFSGAVPRTGVFLDLSKQDSLQPPIEWFVQHGVPVWYPWGEWEIRHAETHPEFARYGPSLEALRPRTPLFLPSSPTPSRSPSPCMMRVDDPKPASPLHHHEQNSVVEELPHQTWQDFLAQRSLRNAELEISETPHARQVRLDRMRNPPTTNTKVFIWTYGNDSKLLRERIPKSQNDETIGEYGLHQKKYDAFHNEWDLCEEFGPHDEDDGSYDEDDGSYEADDASQPMEIQTAPYYEASLSPTDLDDTAWTPNELSANGLVGIFVDHLGFVPPLKSSMTKTPVVPKIWEQCLRVAGLSRDTNVDDNPFPAFDHIIVSFVQKLEQGKRPTEDEWDLHPHNHLSILQTARFKQIHVISSSLFIIGFPSSRDSLPWKLAVRNAVDALYICRLNAKFSKYHVARCLVEQGIPFRTLLPLRRILSGPCPLIVAPILPIRLPGYTFTKEDYFVYQKHRASVFSSPRGRAVLLRGGIVWRLAKEYFSADAVLQGPSPTSTVHREGFSTSTSREDCQLYDDDLSTLDLELICGVYKCFTGNGDQIAMKSWWPAQSTWEQGGENYGRWTPWNESWYQERLQQIRDGRAEPLPASKWRDRLRGLRQVRLIQTNLSKFAQDILPAAQPYSIP